MRFIPYPTASDPYKIRTASEIIVSPDGRKFEARRIYMDIDTPSVKGYQLVACQCSQSPKGIVAVVTDHGCSTRSKMEKAPFWGRIYFENSGRMCFETPRYEIRMKAPCGFACNGGKSVDGMELTFSNMADYAPLLERARDELGLSKESVSFVKDHKFLGSLGHALIAGGYVIPDSTKECKRRKTLTGAVSRFLLKAFG